MARLYVVSVFDRKVQNYMRPLFCRAIGEAMRIFRDEVNRADQQNVLHQHPEDFDLYHLGFFDEEVGRLEPISPVMLDHGSVASKAEAQ